MTKVNMFCEFMLVVGKPFTVLFCLYILKVVLLTAESFY